MSLYNTIHGVNRFSGIIVFTLDLELDDIARFRDAWIEDDKIIIYNRCGAGNKRFPETNTTGCIGYWEEIRDHPNYIRDYEDDFDPTYTYTEFEIPEEYKEFIEHIRGKQDRDGSHVPQTEEEIEEKVERMMEDNSEQLEPIISVLEDLTKDE